MANLTLLSERQIQAQILARLIAQLGINDVNPGSVIDVLTQAVAQQDFSLYYQIAQVTRLVDLDALSGTDLDNKAFEYGLERVTATKTKGQVDILRPIGFVKVSTTFYAGSPAAIAGNTTIDVNDASNVLIGSSGTLIIGRGTNNEEEINYSVAPVNNTVFWRYTLASPLVNNHAVEETVILKQDIDRVIVAGTVVVVPATGVTAQLTFTTDSDNTLLAGEEEVDGVEVTASVPGTASNISVGAISGAAAFTSPPFAGAQAFNPQKFTTGLDLESDDSLRDRIKNYIQGISRGVKQAILNAIVGLVDPGSAKRVVSASIIDPVATTDAVKIYIDDGTGFEPSFDSVGFETIRTTTGGEQRFQVAQFPVVKAQLQANSFEPYDMSSGPLTLQYQVANVSETITFQTSDFLTPNIARAQEIVARINALSTLLEARTADGGTSIIINAKADTNENLQITGGTANAIINFPTDRKDTISLYVDDVKLSKDGLTALVDSQNHAPFNLAAIGAYPHTLSMIVDGKTANPQTCSIGTSDVSDQTSVTAQEICNVINRDIAGVLATTIDSGANVRIQSLTLLSASSKIQITGGDLNDATHGLNMTTAQQVGADGDYTFNRELGIIETMSPLAANKVVTLGSIFTRAKLRAAVPELYSPSTGQTLVISVDGGADQTITFDNTFAGGGTAQQLADFINLQLRGGTALVRTVAGVNYLEINTNTYSGGTIKIESSSTANGSFSFTLSSTATSTAPNKAFLVSANAGPYNFAQGDSLVVVVDNDIVNNTFSILMNYAAAVTVGSTTSVFRSSTLSQIFPVASELVNYYVAFTSGANTTAGVVDQVNVLGGGTVKYHFSTIPPGFGSYAVGDLFSVSGLNESENNGNFGITAIGSDYVEVINANGVNGTSETGACVLSLRRRVSAYSAGTGQITVATPFLAVPAAMDNFIVIPSTVDNLVSYINNTKITSFTLKGTVEGVNNDQYLQLSSDSEGSDGYIQITGGAANIQLGFVTTVFRGLQAYSYWTGLLKLVHQTIYGDDEQLSAFGGIGAAGITFRVLAPTVRQLEIQLTLTLANGVTISSLQNVVKSAVTGYVNTLGVGDEVIIEQIRAAVIAIPGITDVVIVTPTANIPINDNERADVANSDILIG
jgi:uncharacterized phage protein gp47/JayE